MVANRTERRAIIEAEKARSCFSRFGITTGQSLSKLIVHSKGIKPLRRRTSAIEGDTAYRENHNYSVLILLARRIKDSLSNDMTSVIKSLPIDRWVNWRPVN